MQGRALRRLATGGSEIHPRWRQIGSGQIGIAEETSAPAAIFPADDAFRHDEISGADSN